MTLVLALLWHRHQGDEQNQQLAAVRKAGITGLEALVAQRGPELADLSPALRLALIELCLPTLKTLSVQQYQQLKQLLLNFVRADGHIDLFEWCLFQLLRHYL